MAATYQAELWCDDCANSPTRMIDGVPMCDKCYSDFLENSRNENIVIRPDPIIERAML